MDASHFDRATRSLAAASSRRLLLRGLATLGLALAHLPSRVRAKKRKKKLKFNEFGCVNVGGKCRGKDNVCCSGICQGKKPKKGNKDKSKCVAHGVGGCQPDQDHCVDFQGNACPDNASASCWRTTGQSSFCGDGGNSACVVCAKDVDCEALYGAGAACVVCVDCSQTGTLCVSPAV